MGKKSTAPQNEDFEEDAISEFQMRIIDLIMIFFFLEFHICSIVHCLEPYEFLYKRTTFLNK